MFIKLKSSYYLLACILDWTRPRQIGQYIEVVLLLRIEINTFDVGDVVGARSCSCDCHLVSVYEASLVCLIVQQIRRERVVLHCLLAISSKVLLVGCAIIENGRVVHEVVGSATKHYVTVAHPNTSIGSVWYSLEAWQLFDSWSEGWSAKGSWRTRARRGILFIWCLRIRVKSLVDCPVHQKPTAT